MKSQYIFGQLKGDLFGGLTAGVVALPLALAFGVASGFGAVAGLYGAIALGLFAALFGGTPTQISGPTGPMTVVFASAVMAFPGNPSAILGVVFFAGLFQIGFGLLKVGGFVRYIPYPVISGFMSGIGVIIILIQLHPLLGAPSVSSPIEAVLKLPQALSIVNNYSLILAFSTMAIVFFTPSRISAIIPSPLIALLGCTTLSIIFKFPVDTIGPIPAALPKVALPFFSPSLLSDILPMAMALAILGMMDSLLTSVVADSMTKTRHNSNRELIGQGLGNIFASIIGGLPGAGATMRTVVNIKAGGTTRVSGLSHSLFLLTILLGMGQYAAHIPLPVLAGILMKVGIDILDYRLLRMVKRIPGPDLAVMLIVFVTTVFVDLMIAVGVGVTLSSLMITYRISRQLEVDIKGVRHHEWQRDLEKSLEEETDYRIRTLSVMGAFFFGTTAKMQEQVSKLIGTKVVIINCLDVSFIDLSGYFALSEMIDRLKYEKIKTIVVVREGVGIKTQMLNMGYENLLGSDGIQVDYNVALHLAWDYLEDQK
ncbi:SulP family inorganic anion transporter [Desulforhopalus sp. IMCC35007]|uniref:SulP family inorganic anion transporter n=1 Tax=Desulforhopalus sp. IMCC35007 TaxID=2569543 RepID=UPI0010AE9A99|nr:SulP family inorganic anion transporter [Desulforhopalus sp. IMCC35007]TKB12099.1 SulP family inorganic anion transporter [Desulforhopalus sp. IMCC35007]